MSKAATMKLIAYYFLFLSSTTITSVSSTTTTATWARDGRLTTTTCPAFLHPTNVRVAPQRHSYNNGVHTSSYSPLSISPTVAVAMSKSSNSSLQQRILDEATMKLRNNDLSGKTTSQKNSVQANYLTTYGEEDGGANIVETKGKFTYYVRDAKLSEINEITDVLMDAFHTHKQPTFDSYIRRYKYNHLKMFFEAINECDRGLFVACAVPVSPSSSLLESTTTALEEKEEIVGFCSIDGRNPDPSCKVEFLTPSTLASNSPRPYLSDLGVSPSHRRRGIGDLLVNECEEWTRKRGHKKLYLKVDEKNVGGMGLYLGMGYTRVKLPWSHVGKSGNQWDTTILLEKSILNNGDTTTPEKQEKKREWVKKQSRSILQRIWKGRSASSQINEDAERDIPSVDNAPRL